MRESSLWARENTDALQSPGKYQTAPCSAMLTTYFWPVTPQAKTTRVIQIVNVPKNIGLFGMWPKIRVPEPRFQVMVSRTIGWDWVIFWPNTDGGWWWLLMLNVAIIILDPITKDVTPLIMTHYFDSESRLLCRNVIMKHFETRSLVFFGSVKS